jgi:RimJ/RimL family protein N-acetyltransferase
MTVLPRTLQDVIAAEQIVLRPLNASDAEAIELFAGDARIAKMTSRIPHPLPVGATRALLTRAVDPIRDEDIWAMDASAQGGAALMGLISLTRLDADQSEVGYWVAPAFWNGGTASAAVEALVAANPLGNRTMFASVFQDNPASARVLTRAGFDYIGDAETFSIARGETVPTWTYLRKLAPSGA